MWPSHNIWTLIDIAHRRTCISIYNDFVCDTLVLMINVEKKTHLGHLITILKCVGRNLKGQWENWMYLFKAQWVGINSEQAWLFSFIEVSRDISSKLLLHIMLWLWVHINIIKVVEYYFNVGMHSKLLRSDHFYRNFEKKTIMKFCFCFKCDQFWPARHSSKSKNIKISFKPGHF